MPLIPAADGIVTCVSRRHLDFMSHNRVNTWSETKKGEWTP